SGSMVWLLSSNVLSSLMVWSGGTVRTGALFTSATMMVKLLVALRGGRPLSVTFTVIRLVLGPWASVGVHASTPVSESSVIPAGADNRFKVIVLAGRSGSKILTMNASLLCSSIVSSRGRVSLGCVFTSLTTTRKLFVVLSGGEPLS